MTDQLSGLRVILIGGASNVGKSTLAESLAATLGWRVISTDSLARHPGRPWGQVRPHVADHYLSLSIDELILDVVRHWERMWPDVEQLITAHATDASSECLILEGSALRPEYVAHLDLGNVAPIWLTADDGVLQERIYRTSGFDQATDSEQSMIEKFLQRSRRDNQRTMAAVRRLALPWLDAGGSLPGDAIVLAKIAGRAPHRAVFPVEVDCRDRP